MQSLIMPPWMEGGNVQCGEGSCRCSKLCADSAVTTGLRMKDLVLKSRSVLGQRGMPGTPLDEVIIVKDPGP